MDDRFCPVFIIGYPRSGTTLLLHILLTSEDFPKYDFTETHFFSHYYMRYGNLKKRRNVRRFLEEVFSSNWFRSSGILRGDILGNIDVNNLSYGTFFATFMNILAENQGKSRWIEKTPWHILYVPEILQTFPSAKFIHMVRDPRDVALSIQKAGWTKGLLKNFARVLIAWKWHIKHLERAINGRYNMFLTLKYEDLLVRTETTLKDINSFLGTNLELGKVESTKVGVINRSNTSYSESIDGISTKPLERWRRIMEPDMKELAAYLVGEYLTKFEYELGTRETPGTITKVEVKTLELLYHLAKRFRMLTFPIFRR